MKSTKLLAIVLCVCMVVSMFAACGDTTTTNSDISNANTVSGGNDQYIDQETGEIINIGSPKTMAITPEEVGELENPVVTGLEAWMNDSRLKTTVALREQAYGIKYDYDTCNQEERMAKWVSAFVSGDAYDVFQLIMGDFPIIAQKGLIHPLENILPVHDSQYFNQSIVNAYTWKGRVYGVSDADSGIDVYGVFWNDTIFSNAGETTPRELYDAGNWNWKTFENLIKSMHSVEGTANDVYGLAGSYDYLARASIVSNGGSVITYTDVGADITLSSKETMEAIEWTNKIREYNHASGRPIFVAGMSAMYLERQSQINAIRLASPNYDFDWVPFPEGPTGIKDQSGQADAWGIGKGAKNIAGALAWICAGNYYETWAEANNIVNEKETRTEEEIEFGKEISKLARMDNYSGFDISLWGLLEDAKVSGTAAAIEKYTPQFQAKVDAMLGVKSEVGGIDFEDRGVIDFETKDNYPFVNVIGDDKVSYGTTEVPSLKIDLSGMTEFGPIIHTNPELYNIQKGGQYKITFKLFCEEDPGAETFAVVARTTENLTGGSEFGLTWLSPKANEVYEVETYVNVNENYNGTLSIVLLGSATETNPDLTIFIDDFRVELVAQ